MERKSKVLIGSLMAMLVMSTFVSIAAASSQTRAPNGVGQSGGGSQQAWVNLGNIYSFDQKYVSVVGLEMQTSYSYTLIVGFAFNIPQNANITGVVLTIWHKATNGYRGNVYDYVVKLSVAGSQNKAKIWAWGTSEESYAYGGSSDKWGCSLTPSNVNNIAIYLQVKMTTSGPPSIAYVDYMTLQVFYN